MSLDFSPSSSRVYPTSPYSTSSSTSFATSFIKDLKLEREKEQQRSTERNERFNRRVDTYHARRRRRRSIVERERTQTQATPPVPTSRLFAPKSKNQNSKSEHRDVSIDVQTSPSEENKYESSEHARFQALVTHHFDTQSQFDEDSNSMSPSPFLSPQQYQPHALTGRRDHPIDHTHAEHAEVKGEVQEQEQQEDDDEEEEDERDIFDEAEDRSGCCAVLASFVLFFCRLRLWFACSCLRCCCCKVQRKLDASELYDHRRAPESTSCESDVLDDSDRAGRGSSTSEAHLRSNPRAESCCIIECKGARTSLCCCFFLFTITAVLVSAVLATSFVFFLAHPYLQQQVTPFCLRMHACPYIYIYRRRLRECVCECVCAYTCKCVHVNVCAYTCMHACIYMISILQYYVCVCISWDLRSVRFPYQSYTCMHACVYTYTYS